MRRALLVAAAAFAVAGAAAGESSLIDAAKNSDREAVRVLLQKRVDVNAPAADGTTALHWASVRDDLETAFLEMADHPVGGPVFSTDEKYTAKITVPPDTLNEENPGDPTQSGTYKIVVTAFLDSDLGPVGYDMMGYAEGPIIKVESPL